MYLVSNLISTGANTDISKPFRYFRLYDETGKSKCELVEVNLYGFISSDAVESNGDLTCDISISINNSSEKIFKSSASYIGSKTSVV